MANAVVDAVLPLARATSLFVYRLIWFASWLLYWVASEVFRLVKESITQDPAAVSCGAAAALAATASTSTSSPSAPQTSTHKAGAERDTEFVMQLLRCTGRRPDDRDSLSQAVDEVRAAHRDVRLSLQAEIEPEVVAVLGRGEQVRQACGALAKLVSFELEPPPEAFFALHFAMREACDLPEDDELADASLDSDWIDLGCDDNVDSAQEGSRRADEGSDRQQRTRSPQSVLQGRLREVLPSRQDVQVLMDRNPFASSGRDAVRVDFVGPLQPAAWDTATRTVLVCEASGVYLSRQYDVVFWCPTEQRRLLEDQVESALSHWKGSRMKLGSGFGLADTGFPGFEDLAANVSAVLRGDSPPGWHRLEWTPHGAGAVPHMTY